MHSVWRKTKEFARSWTLHHKSGHHFFFYGAPWMFAGLYNIIMKFDVTLVAFEVPRSSSSQQGRNYNT